MADPAARPAASGRLQQERRSDPPAGSGCHSGRCSGICRDTELLRFACGPHIGNGHSRRVDDRRRSRHDDPDGHGSGRRRHAFGYGFGCGIRSRRLGYGGAFRGYYGAGGSERPPVGLLHRFGARPGVSFRRAGTRRGGRTDRYARRAYHLADRFGSDPLRTSGRRYLLVLRGRRRRTRRRQRVARCLRCGGYAAYHVASVACRHG